MKNSAPKGLKLNYTETEIPFWKKKSLLAPPEAVKITIKECVYALSYTLKTRVIQTTFSTFNTILTLLKHWAMTLKWVQ